MTVQIGAQTEYLNGHFHTPTLHTHAHTHTYAHDNTYTSPQQQQQQRYDQPSTKELAITSSATRGTPPPPLVGSAIVLVNDSALHCFGGRLENREFTNCHYVLDVETGFWETIEPAPTPSSSSPPSSSSSASNATPSSSTPTTNPLNVPETPSGDDASSTEPTTLLSLSLTTDPVSTNSGSLSSLSFPPQPRYFHTLNSFEGQVILFGGMGTVSMDDEGNSGSEENESNGGSDKDTKSKEKKMVAAALNDLHVYDITAQRWEQKHPVVNAFTPRPRWAHMATIMDHFLVVIGGTDTDKNYVEDACVLDMEIWEWVATVPNIGQCGSYRTIAATGPSKQSTGAVAPSSPSFPSANASSPQTSSNLSWISSDAGNIDAMASISMVLSGRISAPSTNTAYSSSQDQDDDSVESPKTKKTSSERLRSSELTPSFKSGKDGLSIYLYSNYNFQNLQRELKVITPHYNPHPITKDCLSAFGPPSFSLVEKSQALSMMGHELPVGLRFPQGHVFQNQLIVTGTLIAPGKAPTLAIYAFNLMSYKWERLDTDCRLETGSWNRTLLHPATGTLLIFGRYGSNAEMDYANRIQHHDHLMMINLQAYGLYERPVPSLPQGAQDLGVELLNEIGLNDMHVASVTGTLFGANSTVLAARWPEFASLLLSPPYVTPLILELPVPDEVVPLFLQYLYTGALPTSSAVTAGMADYLLILARRYELNGLYALTMDILHQAVETNSMRIHTTALLAGELGLSARAVSLALKTLPRRRAPTATTVAEIVQKQRLSRSFSGAAPPATRPPHPPSSTSSSSLERRRVSRDSRDSISTDGGYVAEGILQQYRPPAMIQEGDEETFVHGEAVRQRKHRSPPAPIASYQQQGYGSSGYGSPLSSPGVQGSIAGGGYQSQQQHQQFAAASYPSPLSPSFQSHPFMSQPIQTAYNGFSDDEGSGVMSIQERLAAKKRHQLQQYADMDPQALQQQQQLLLEQQQRLHEQELMLAEQHHRQQQLFIQKQLQLKQQQKEIAEHAVLGALEYHFGNSSGHGSSSSKHNKKHHHHHHHTTSIVDTLTSQKSNGSKNGSSGKENSSSPSSKDNKDKDKKGLFTKMKPPKSKVSGADLMKSAGF
ncbi:hypothetical protein BG005_005571 [Podila minutissima]|nr:hypothetical protein BG005_005571 [Podila minutissima]